MSIKQKLIKNTGFNIAGYIYLLLASFFSIPILLHNLGRDLFGFYMLLASFISLSSVFDFGISTALIRKLSLANIGPSEKEKYWRSSLFMFLIISALVALTAVGIMITMNHSLVIFRLITQYDFFYVCLILGFLIFVNNLNNHYLTLPQANQRFDIYNLKSLLVGSANTILSALVSYYSTSLITIFGFQFGFHLLTFLVLFWYSQGTFSLSQSAPHYDKETSRDLLHFGLRNFIGTVAGQAEAQFSNFILGAMSSAKAVTAFNIPQSIVSKGAGIISQFAQAFFPLSASLLTKERINKLKTLFIVVELSTFTAGIIAVVLSHTIGYQFLLWWLKDVTIVNMATPILKILSWYFVLVALTPVPTAMVQALDKPHVASFFAVLTVTLEIGTSLYLVPIYGAQGIAYSFLIASLVSVPSFLITSWILFTKEVSKYHPN